MIRRTYACLDCDTIFEVECESNAPDPDCPTCSVPLEWRPQRLTIGGSNLSKAVNYAQDIIENDYGMTNFKDNNKPGEVGVVMPSQTTAEKEKVEREVREMMAQTSPTQVKNDFWGANHGAPSHINTVTAQSMIAAAKVGPQGTDPMAMLHQGVKKGIIPRPEQMSRIVAAADMQGKRTR